VALPPDDPAPQAASEATPAASASQAPSAPAWEDPRRVLARHGLSPKRGFSQNFLVSKHVVDAIVAALAPAQQERVVELGPGLGTLTAALLREGARVIAIDADRDMLKVLGHELAHVPTLETRHGDATEVDFAALACPDGRIAVVGNLPYAVTGSIFRNLVDQHAHVQRAVLMIQREVRDRLLAKPATREYGALTVFTHAVYEVQPVCLVPAGAFFPAPRVDSAVLRLVPRSAPVDATHPGFVSAVRAAFEARRKTLRNALLKRASKDAVEAALKDSGIDGVRRGETLSVDEFFTLGKALLRATEAAG
jgi:16S rRNA (adenine1518-N6/adenine1519-N6)-dimethyltransferase